MNNITVHSWVVVGCVCGWKRELIGNKGHFEKNCFPNELDHSPVPRRHRLYCGLSLFSYQVFSNSWKWSEGAVLRRPPALLLTADQKKIGHASQTYVHPVLNYCLFKQRQHLRNLSSLESSEANGAQPASEESITFKADSCWPLWLSKATPQPPHSSWKSPPHRPPDPGLSNNVNSRKTKVYF